MEEILESIDICKEGNKIIIKLIFRNKDIGKILLYGFLVFFLCIL